MKKTITATLVDKTMHQRFYELSEPIYKGKGIRGIVDIVTEIKEFVEKRINPEYKKYIRTDGCHIICVSDAHTHTERLVFAAEIFPFGYGRIDPQIDGKHTFMIHGGDSNSIYADEVYLRHLGMINGVTIQLKPNNTL